MKKFSIFSVIFMCVMVMSLGFVKLNDKPKANSVDDFLNFKEQVVEACENDDYNIISISEENLTAETLADTLGFSKKSTVEGFAFTDKTGETVEFKNDGNYLDFRMLCSICDDYGYAVLKTSDGCEIYRKFALKRLIVIGDYSDSYGATKVISGYKDYSILCYDSEVETSRAFSLLKKENAEVYIDYITTTADYDYSNFNSWGAEAMQVGSYLDQLALTGTDNDVVVVVIDSGLNTSHEMFEGRVLTDANDKIVGDYVEYESEYTYSGYGFEDDDGHGTHVSGTICELTPDNVKILPIKVFDSTGHGTSVATLTAVESVYNYYSIEYNVACINMSLGGPYDYDNYLDYTDLFADLRTDRNVLAVVAAGNDYSNTSYYLPAACENAIVVSALKKTAFGYEFDDSYSNYGMHVDVSAPGTEIKSAYISETNSAGTSEYVYLSGTSMATPHVTAAVALFCCESDLYDENDNPLYKASEIETKLFDNTLDLGEHGKDTLYGYGLVHLQYADVARLDDTISFYHDSTLIDTTAGYYSFDTTMQLTMESSDDTLEIYYTTDGSIPSITNGTKYTSAIQVDRTSVYKAMAYKIENEVITATTNVFAVELFSAYDPIESYFEIDESGTITSYSGHFETLEIPSVINEITVKTLGVELFRKSELVSVTLPNTCTNIAGAVFESCENLETVIAPGVTKIYDAAFFGCEKLKKVTDTPLAAGETGVYIPNIESVKIGVFAYCAEIEEVKLSNLVTIEDAEFYGCISLKTCDLPNITQIPYASFYECESLNRFIVNKNVTYIDESAFLYTPTQIIVDSANEYYYADGSALYDDTSLVRYFSQTGQGYSISEGVTIAGSTTGIVRIGNFAMHNINISKLTIPSTITTIGKNAMANSNFGTISYGARNATEDGYYDDGYFVVFFDSYAQNVIIESTARNVPTHLFYELYTENLYIKSILSTFETNALKFKNCSSIYFDFNEQVTNSYYSNFIKSGAVNYYQTKFFKTEPSISDEITGETQGYYYSSSSTLNLIPFEAKNITYDYDGNEHNINVNVDSSVTNYTITYGLTPQNYDISSIEGNSNFIDKVNNRAIYFKISAPNHFDAYGCATLSIKTPSGELTDVTITLYNQTSVYGEIVNPSDTLYYADIDEDVSMIELNIKTSASKTSDVGTYTLTADVLYAAHFNVTIIDASYIITKRSVSIELKQQTSQYGEPINFDKTNYTVTEGTIIEGDDLDLYLVTPATSKSNVGSYLLSVYVVGNENYDVEHTPSNYVITPRVLKFSLENQEKEYGKISLDQTKYVITSGTIIAGDDIGLTLYTYTSEITNVGNYIINLKLNNKNYTCAYYDPAVLKVKPKQLKIKIGDQVRSYGEILKSSTIKYEIIEGEIIEGDDLELKIASNANARSDVGVYKLSAIAENKNYDVSFILGQLTVEKRDVTVQLRNQSSYYGDDIVLNNKAYLVVSGEVLEGDDLMLTLTTLATKNSGAGFYSIYGTSASPNYNCIIEEGNYSIKPRVIRIKLQNQETYEGSVDIDQKAYEIVSGEILNSDDLKIAIYSSTAEERLQAGQTYTLKGRFTNTNYTVIFEDADLVVLEPVSNLSGLPMFLIYGAIGVVALVIFIILGRKKKHKEDDVK